MINTTKANKNQLKNYLTRGLIFSLVFWLCYQFSLHFRVLPYTDAVSAFYPAPALTIALIYVFGWRYLPVVFVAACFASAPYDVPWDQPTFVWFNNLRQVIVYGSTALLLSKLLSQKSITDSSHNVLIFITLSVTAAFISACVALSIFVYFNVVPERIYLATFFSLWAGDVTGILMFAPLAFLTCSAWKIARVIKEARLFLSKHKELTLGVILIPSILSAAFFGYILNHPDMSGYGYLILVPVIWVAAKHGLLFGSLTALASNISAAAIYSLLQGDIYTPSELQVIFAVASGISLFIGASRDDRLKAENRALAQDAVLADMTRMASLGELSTMIAHEIATPLQAATTNIQMSISQLKKTNTDSSQEILEYNNEVQYALRQAIKIHHRIRESSHNNNRVRVQIKPTDLHAKLEEALHLLHRSIQLADIEVKIIKHTDLPLVKVDSVGVLQVFINLLKNAIQAMVEAESETKEIICSFRPTDSQLLVSVADSGPGLKEAEPEKIFESFYTTKTKGLGLGLAICRTILEGSGGNISHTKSEQGACFTISLPIHPGEQ